MTQTPLFDVPELDDPPPRRSRRRWVRRCDECKRRIWGHASLRAGPDGKRRGDKCRRAWNRAHRRLRVSARIPVRPPGHIPGQTAIPLPDQEQP